MKILLWWFSSEKWFITHVTWRCVSKSLLTEKDFLKKILNRKGFFRKNPVCKGFFRKNPFRNGYFWKNPNLLGFFLENILPGQKRAAHTLWTVISFQYHKGGLKSTINLDRAQLLQKCFLFLKNLVRHRTRPKFVQKNFVNFFAKFLRSMGGKNVVKMWFFLFCRYF